MLKTYGKKFGRDLVGTEKGKDRCAPNRCRNVRCTMVLDFVVDILR
jgi:hypothetical protein